MNAAPDPALVAPLNAPRTQPAVAPREHGALGQLGFPLATALLLGRPSIPAALLAVACVAVLFAHEPASVLLGARGAKARTHASAASWRRLTVLGVLAAALAWSALADGSTGVRLGALVPSALGCLAVAMMLAGRERTGAGEFIGAATLAAASLPVALAAHVAPRVAVSMAGAWAFASVAQTAAVRGLIGRAKAGGSTGPAMRAAWGAAAGAALCALLAARGVVPVAVAAATIPPTLATVIAAVRPVPPRRLRAVGWTLMAVSACVFATLVAGLR